MACSVIVTLLSICGGCAAVFPTLEHRSGSAGTRGELPEKSLQFIQTGVTTRQDVMLTLGEPDIAINDDTWFAYRWVMMTGGWCFAVPNTVAPIGGGSEFDKAHALIIEFYSRGVVLRFETKTEKFAGDLTYDDLTHW